MRDDNLMATVNYQDFTGTVAADYRDQAYLEQLAEKYGVDIQKYFVFGIHIYLGEFGTEFDRTTVYLLAVDRNVVPAADNDSVQQYIESHEGTLPYEKFSIQSYLGEILEYYFKRFDLVLTYRNIKADKYQLTN